MKINKRKFPSHNNSFWSCNYTMKNSLLVYEEHDQDSRFLVGVMHMHVELLLVGDDWGERERNKFFLLSFLSHLIQLVILLNHFLCKFRLQLSSLPCAARRGSFHGQMNIRWETDFSFSTIKPYQIVFIYNSIEYFVSFYQVWIH